MADKLATEFSAMGFQVEILTNHMGGNYPETEQRKNFTVRRFHTGRKSTLPGKFYEHIGFFVLGLPQIFFYIYKSGFDYLFPIFVVPTGLIALIIAKILGIPTVVFVDAADTPGIQSHQHFWIKLLSPFFYLVTRYSNGVIICEGLEDVAGPMISNTHLGVIANGTDLPTQISSPGERDGKLQFLSIGRLVLRKGFMDVIKALAEVKKQRSDFLLTIIGYGVEADRLQQYLEQYDMCGNIVLAGRVEYDELVKYYLNSDCYIFYGDMEGSSLAMVEALAYGLPIIASDHPGNRSYIKQGDNGLLVEHKNYLALADAISEVLEKRGELPAWGARSRHIASHYSWSNIAKQYKKFFDSAIK